MVFSKYKTLGFWLTLCGYYINTLYTLYTQYTLVISVEDEFLFGLSASKITFCWVVSVEDVFGFLIYFVWFLLVHTLDTPLQT